MRANCAVYTVRRREGKLSGYIARVGVGSIDPRSTASSSKDHGVEGVSTYIMAAIATTVVGPLVWRHGRCEKSSYNIKDGSS